ncbi:MAG: outer membrane protein assembly factor BamD [Bacteroidaceae bacterium]|nr:outer membrane protein assembly factor BamD [Bacteroidaceae bacterium]MBP5523561.1 outer membrane protein assembly factor BamD [Bacteroidaceae bacterium]MBQ4379828.1 outer membrane protein assembly factor BamD [Bacteroidaceae bacterium]
MRFKSIIFAISAVLFVSCKTTYNTVLKSTDYDYKYEAAKEYYAAGNYGKCSQLLEDMVMLLKGTEKAEESLFMLGMCYYNMRDYETATLYLDRYYKTYTKGTYTELARFFSGKASYMQSPDIRLDQSPTITAINTLLEFLDFYPYSDKRSEVYDLLEILRNRLAEKEYQSALLYYNLGSYTGNCVNGGSNYEACIITAENTLKTYPYTSHREDLMMMILRARYRLANKSIASKKEERYRETIDEYFGFKNEFPESKYMHEADKIYKYSVARNPVKDKDIN